jgi:hypothetical protein
MIHPSTPLPRANNTDPPSRQSRLYQHVSHHRRFYLVTLVFGLSIAMGVCLIFVAHYYYHMWGGQGFLGSRSLTHMAPETGNHLPLRQIAALDDRLRFSNLRREPSSPPFYTCGDEQNSCEALSQPVGITQTRQASLISSQIICCPEGLSCYSTSYTTSGIFCCNMTGSPSDCQPSASRPPQCPASTFECSKTVGGGCCPHGTACSENGCILFNGTDSPQPITSTITSTIISVASKMPVPSLTDAQTFSTLTTITMVIGGETFPTATIVKGAEVAQKAEGVRPRPTEWQGRYFPYSSLVTLVIVAISMTFL